MLGFLEPLIDRRRGSKKLLRDGRSRNSCLDVYKRQLPMLLRACPIHSDPYRCCEDSKCPDETTILRFRHLLEKNILDKQVFDLFKQQLTARGLLFSKGTIVDLSLIHISRSRRSSCLARISPPNASSRSGAQRRQRTRKEAASILLPFS